MVASRLSRVNARSARPKPKAVKFPEGVTCRDRALRFHWSADYDALNVQIGLPPCASKKMERVMASIVVDVILAGPHARTSYSRTSDYYRESARYRGTDYGYDTVVGAVDRLLMAGLLVEHLKKEFEEGEAGWQSSFKGACKLAQRRLFHAKS
jgi:hypothetical protein